MNDDTINIVINDTYDLTNQMIDISTVTSSLVYNTDNNSIYINDGNSWVLAPVTTEEILFKNTMPDPYLLDEMCKEYPSLEKAYENFKTIYKMVEQDWIGKQKERNSPPF